MHLVICWLYGIEVTLEYESNLKSLYLEDKHVKQSPIITISGLIICSVSVNFIEPIFLMEKLKIDFTEYIMFDIWAQER